MDPKLVETTVRALSHSQVFHGIEIPALEALVQVSERIETPPGQTLLEEEGRVKGLHVIVEGSAQIVKGGTPLTILGRGAFFGEISLFGVSFSATANVVAKDRTVCIILQKAQLELWGKKHPAAERIFLYRMCTELSRRLYSTSEKL
jgi:CRP-like cAMP-binding protein